MKRPVHSILVEHRDAADGLLFATLQKLAAAASCLMAIAVLAAQ